MPDLTTSRGRTLRINELARSAGISVQQVRNYVDLGVLPPVARTPNGYRVFTEHHAEALSVARRLAEGHGWKSARSIMCATHAGDVARALCLLDRGHAELSRERAEMAALLRSLDLLPEAADRAAAALPRGRVVRISEAAGLLGVAAATLRAWERHGLLRPRREHGTGYRLFDEAELRNARVVAVLRGRRYPLATVRTALDELRAGVTPSRLHDALTERELELSRRSLARLRASAALYDYLEYLGLSDALASAEAA